VIVNQAVTVEAESLVEIIGRITANIGFNVLGSSSITVDGNLKWLTNPDVDEIWDLEPDVEQDWQTVTDQSVIWH
jgi:hypothetical protein